MFQPTVLHARPARLHRGLVATAAAVAVAAAVGFGAVPATAATARVPVETTAYTIGQNPSPAAVNALRAALEALPNGSKVHVGEIIRNFAEGTLG